MKNKRGIAYQMNLLSVAMNKKKEITLLPMKVRPYQQEIVDAFYKYPIVALGWCRRLGKDLCCLHITVEYCLNNPNSTAYYIFPTMKMGKANILEGKTLDNKMIITTVVDKSVLKTPRNSDNLFFGDNTLRFKNGSIIYFLDSDSDNKVGSNVNVLVLSEMGLYKNPNIIDYLIPSVLKAKGHILIASTPRYGSKYNDMLLDSENTTIFRSIIPALSEKAVDENGNPVYTEEELDLARKNMSNEKFQQEYMVDLTQSNESSIYALSFTLSKLVKEQRDLRGKRVYVSMDLGINDAQSMVFSYMEGNKAIVFHWHMNNGQPTKYYVDYIDAILKKYNISRSQVKLLLPHDGRNRMDGYSKLVSRNDLFRQQGFDTTILPAIKQLDGIEICRSSIQNNDVVFTDNIVVNDMISKVKMYEWKTQNGVITYVPEHGVGLSSSNVADSLEYLTIYLFKDKYVENQYKGFKGNKSFSMFKK